MPFSEKARQHALDIIETRRQSAVLRAANHKAELLLSYPALGDFDQEIASCGISLTKAAITGNVDIDAIQLSIEEIKKKRLRYMKKNGIDADRTFYYCEECKDSGFISGELCRCTIQLMIDYTSDTIGKVSPLNLSSFSGFNLDYYSEEPNSKYGNISSRKNMEKILKSCMDFVFDFPKYNNLLFMGDTGLGKTHLALAVANEVIKKGHNVIYCSASNIFKAIESEYFKEGSTETINSMKICDLLILDDLGSEFVNHFLASSLYDIVNTRLISKLSTIYTTNIVNHKDFDRRYGEKISSRLSGCCDLLLFYGEDNRIT